MNVYRLLKKPFFGRFMVKWINPMSDKERMEWEPAPIESKSGAALAGLFARATTDAPPKATIALGHPMGKEAKGYFIKNGYTDLLRQNGYNVLLFDINGFGESGHGNFDYYDDIVAASIKAKSLTPELPIGYHGVSLGGQWATIAFADETHCIDFAIVESAATTLDEFWKHYPLPHRLLKITRVVAPAYTRRIQMVERIKEAKRLQSLLFIYSMTDTYTPADMGERFRQNCPIPSEMWTVPDAGHAAIIKSDFREAYKEKIIAYFDGAVRPL